MARGYLRLNRDERGGSLRELAAALDKELSEGSHQVILDNTYLTRASRSYVIETANRHRAEARCIWLDTPLAQAQVNLVERLLEGLGALPSPEKLGSLHGVSRACSRRPPRCAPSVSSSRRRPTRDLRTSKRFLSNASLRDLRPRVDSSRLQRWGNLVGSTCSRSSTGMPHLVFDWSPGGDAAELAPIAARLSAELDGAVESALCPHGGGPPTCWCRPPLPGLPLAFARAHGLNPSRSILVGTSPAHRTLATTLGSRYIGA